MKKRTRYFLTILGVIFFSTGGYFIYKYLTVQTPETEMKRAVKALADAKKSEATVFAAEKFAEAKSEFGMAMDEWEFQNKQIFIHRNYHKTITLAKKTVELCNEATKKAGEEKDSVKNRMIHLLPSIEQKINYFEKYYKNLPLTKSTFNAYSNSKLKYQEATNSFQQSKIYEALTQAGEAESLINQASAKAKLLLEDYFRDYHLWLKNARLARSLSSRGQTVILVDKLAATCSVLKSGKTLETFHAEFGQNWTGDKIRRGDKATPEGVYKIIRKKDHGNTKYYKSLLLNYPNNEDKARFTALIKKGNIPKNSKIGSLIEIHGDGGKGVSWTDGCIALSNADMDKVFQQCRVSTPVIIIGSERTLNEYLK
ncbi:MAG: L,D-transpeptidase family protein [Bacteroidales bacterium]|nr:L,D-transpeptidase family protein [Bacteroidales bacterium]